MKKLLTVLILVMAGLAVNAQRTPVKVTDLSKAITDNVAKDWAGFTIKDATKVVANNVTTFEVVVVKGTSQETLCYDNMGKFIKKIGTSEGQVTKPAAAPAPKKAPAKAPAKPPVKK
ncbi:MAG: hypothetical protein Q8868_07000 [Bacteroidota bacterium]|nr:hypothetical protein [Bacteroidota bacterium]